MDLPLRASNEGSPRPRVARAQKIIRLHTHFFFNSLLEVVLRHAISQRIPGDLEEPAGFGNVAACALQRFLQHLFFHLINREAVGQERGLLGVCVLSCRLGISQKDWEVVRLDHLVFARDGEPFDHVMQFPYVAGPVVALQDG